jgi:hypothetical protein
MAKKARTPAPPRKVQAPQRREQSRAPGRPGVSEERQRRILYAIAGSGLIALAIVLGVIFATRSSKPGPPGKVNTQVAIPNLARLPGALTGPPPWTANTRKLPQRATILGIPVNQPETVHYHAHLDIFDSGQQVTVPADIGLTQTVGTVLHTHDPSGIIHIEGAEPYPYTLGHFFGVWGVALSKSCVGGLCAKPGTPLQFLVNGHPFHGDPTRLIMESHQEIAVVYGTPPPKIPSSYGFPAGY